MTEVNMTYLWQMPGGIDRQVLRASVLVSSTNNIHADMGVLTLRSALFVSGNTSQPRI